MFILLNIFWFFRTSKYVLFWLYLWQLKEYHVGRFLDHFSTEKGRKLIFNPLQNVKIILMAFWLINDNYLSSVLFLVYFAESLQFLFSVVNKNFKKPVFTKKIIFLSSVLFLLFILFPVILNQSANNFSWFAPLGTGSLAGFAFGLLLFDILVPIIVSAIVLLAQPVFVALRNKVLRQAKEKMEQTQAVSGLKAIAVTGSYGKTSTKEFLATVLSQRFKVLSTKEHQNSEIGIARCILDELKPSHQIFIAEVGAYNKGKVKEVCLMLKPKIGIVTGVNEQHLSLFGSLENLLSAEGGGELAELLPKDGVLAVNGDNKYCLELLKKSDNLPINREKIYASNNKTANADVWSDSVEIYRNYISFLSLNKKGELAHFDVKVLGKHNIQNLLGAVLVASELGMSFGEISEACKNIEPEQAGMVLKQGKHGLNIIDSSYSANPDGVIADLDYLKIFPQKRVIVMPCLIELGLKSSEIHEKIGRKIGEVCDLAIITTKERFDNIKKGVVRGQAPAGIQGNGADKFVFIKDSDEIFSKITTFCKSGDVVLLEGRVPAKLIDLMVL